MTILTIADVRAEPSTTPMKSPFESAKRRSTSAENVLVTVTLSDGTIGYGEASPADYVTGETVATVINDVRLASLGLRGQEVSRVRRWAEALHELSIRPTAASALEMASLDALTRSWGIPLWHYFGGAHEEVETDLTIPISPPAQAESIAAEAGAAGYVFLKIKVGGPDREEDLERVLAVSRGSGGAFIRLDANQAFDVEGALAFVNQCLARGVHVEFMEQPVPADDWEGLAEVTRRSPVPIIADETVVNPAAALRVATTGAAHGINIKVAKAGLFGALQIIAIARAAGLKLMLGCMLETTLGIGASLHLACGTGAFDYLDLDSHTLIGLQATGLPFAQQGPVLRVDPAAPGIGWEPGG